jgi:hypothetical protein
MMNPVIQSVGELGGSGTIEEINDKVAEIAGMMHGEDVSVETPGSPAETEE